MPLSFCHPTAPHQKVKPPEWYVTNQLRDAAREIRTYARRHDTHAARRIAAVEQAMK
jgi:hypothetical protein